MTAKTERLQFRINPHDKWRNVVGIKQRIVLPSTSGGKSIPLDKQYLLEGGIGVPANTAVAERRKRP